MVLSRIGGPKSQRVEELERMADQAGWGWSGVHGGSKDSPLVTSNNTCKH
jgi:hypothetical protein